MLGCHETSRLASRWMFHGEWIHCDTGAQIAGSLYNRQGLPGQSITAVTCRPLLAATVSIGRRALFCRCKPGNAWKCRLLIFFAEEICGSRNLPQSKKINNFHKAYWETPIQIDCRATFSMHCHSLVIKAWMIRGFAWSSGRTSVFGRRAFAVLRSTCSWWVTTYVISSHLIFYSLKSSCQTQLCTINTHIHIYIQ